MNHSPQANLDHVFENIAVELMRALRGSETQMSVSTALGYSFNQVSKWESREKSILVADFLKLAALRNKSPRQIFANAFFHQSDETEQTHILLKEMQGPLSVTDFAKQIDENRNKVTRWLNAEVEMPLSSFLKILHLSRNTADILVASVVPIDQVPTIEAFYKNSVALADRLAEKPWTTLFMQMLTHPTCPTADKVPEYMAGLFKIDMATIEQAIKEMTDLGILKTNSEGFYERPTRRLNVSKNKGGDIKQYFFKAGTQTHEQLLKRLDDDFLDENLFGFLVLSASDASWLKIRDHYRLFFDGLRQIIDEDEDIQKKVKLVNVQIFDAEDMCSSVSLGSIK